MAYTFSDGIAEFDVVSDIAGDTLIGQVSSQSGNGSLHNAPRVTNRADDTISTDFYATAIKQNDFFGSGEQIVISLFRSALQPDLSQETYEITLTQDVAGVPITMASKDVDITVTDFMPVIPTDPVFDDDTQDVDLTENAIGTVVGTYTAQSVLTLTYTLSGEDAVYFAIDASTGEVTLAGSSANLGNNRILAVYVIATDTNDASDNLLLTVTFALPVAPVRQLTLLAKHPSIRFFDVVTGVRGDTPTIEKAMNAPALLTSDIDRKSAIVLGLFEAFATVTIIPVDTIPDIEVNDWIYRSSDNTLIPINAYKVVGINQVAGSYRQILICQRSID